MQPDLSEFSFGFAITDELINHVQMPITAAPVFPSLYSEGQIGGGYDLRLERPGIPLFLQFKLCHCMVSRTAKEHELGLLNVPYFRMFLRQSLRSRQHELLLRLEASGQEVFYCAPAFYESTELNRYYMMERVCRESIWVSPSFIGRLPDDDIQHYCAFQNSSARSMFVCSEPRKIDGSLDFGSFTRSTVSQIDDRGSIALSNEGIGTLARQMIDMVGELAFDPIVYPRIRVATSRKQHPLQKIALLARVHFGCQLYVAHLTE